VETARGDEMRLRNLILILAALTVVVALAACSSAGQSSGDQGKKASEEQAQKKEPPKKMTDEAKSKQVAPKEGAEGGPGNGENELKPPKSKMLKLTVPKMKMIKDDKIPTGIGTNEALFHDYAGVHLKRTGFPWEKTANVYIAGHRIGFPGTNSDLAFYDLEDLEKGDMVYVKDADGRQYTYKVFKKLIVEPTDLSVLKPIKGKNILSLQTCTLPDYTDRVIYQAELQDVKS
jgi:sortase A